MRTNRIKGPLYVVSLVLIVLCSFLVSAQEPEPEMVFVRGGKLTMGSNLGVKDEKTVPWTILHQIHRENNRVYR